MTPRARRAAAVCALALLAAPAGAFAGGPSGGSPPSRLYVAPDGDDADPGTKDAPFRTLERARDALRPGLGQMRRDVRVVLRGGVHRLARPFELTPADSGRNGHAVIYTAYPGERPTLSGGTPVEGFTPDDAAPGIYRADAGTSPIRQLVVGGRLAMRARSEPGELALTPTATGFEAASAADVAWARPGEVEIVASMLWASIRCRISSLDGLQVTLMPACWDLVNAWYGAASSRFVRAENARELLDEPGEWYHDRTTGDLFYKPRPGEDLTTTPVVAARLEHLAVLTGTPAAPVHDVRFRGLHFEDSAWFAPEADTGYVASQSGYRLLGVDYDDWAQELPSSTARQAGALELGTAHDVKVIGSTFRNLAATAVAVGSGSRGVEVVGNRIEDIGGTGVHVGDIRREDHHPADASGVTSRIDVTNNLIRRVGIDFADSVGVFGGYVRRLAIAQNELSDLPYIALQIGWGWGTVDPGGNPVYPPGGCAFCPTVPSYSTPTPMGRNRITGNRVTRFMQVLSDGGAIYTQSAQPGSVIAGNHLVGMGSDFTGAIYLDDGTRGYTVRHNVIADAVHAFFVHERGNFDAHPCGNARGNRVSWNWSTSPGGAHEIFPEGGLGRCDGQNVIRRNRVVPDGAWPAAARRVIARAGLQEPWRSRLAG
jgi:hypothetical protein